MSHGLTAPCPTTLDSKAETRRRCHCRRPRYNSRTTDEGAEACLACCAKQSATRAAVARRASTTRVFDIGSAEAMHTTTYKILDWPARRLEI